MSKNPDEYRKELERFLNLLNQFLKGASKSSSDKPALPDLETLLKKKEFTLNLCFFTFFPFGLEEASKFEESLKEMFGFEHAGEGGPKFELTEEDIHFLKKYGIQF